MELDPIALAIPFFFVLIGVELLIARHRRQRVYRYTDAMTDLFCGVSNQLVSLLLGATLLAFYAWLHDRFRVVTLPTWGQWVAAIAGVDFLYYWWHRLSHEVNVLWAAHVVHHSSEDYNLAVALRQSVLTPFTQLAFYLPLAFLGVSLLPFATVAALSTLYQFWIHTELVGVMPLADGLVNTPSVHRVHHAINPRYLDKNYAAVFMIWDRLFGTFEREVEAPVYGISVPLASYSPLWAQFHYCVELVQKARSAPSIGLALAVFVRSPAWQAPWLPRKESCFRPEGIEKYDPKASPRLRRWVSANFALIAALLVAMLLREKTLPREAIYAGCAFVFVSLVAWGGLFEKRRWAIPLEAARVVGALAVVSVFALRQLE